MTDIASQEGLKEGFSYPQSLSILYVEDNEEVRESTAEMLELFFERVDIAKNGLCGIEKYTQYHKKNKKHYDIIFTDIKMPKMNGLEMSKIILEKNMKQYIIVISAHNEAEFLLELIDIGIVDFILKPINLKKFKYKIERIIELIRNQEVVDKEQASLIKMNTLLVEAQKKAEDASMQKSSFLANMSHEIRTPLNAIRGFIALLGENEKDKEKLNYMEIINNASDLLLQIINDVLDISKIEEGKMILDEIDFEPYTILMDTAEIFQAKALEKGVVLDIEYHRPIPHILYGDIFKVKQIFTNLISNALKFSSKEEKIHCQIYYKDKKLILSVKDEGIGISPENQKRIFDSFSQAENSTTREYGGTGLGLSISRKLTALLGGEITLKSALTKGSLFTLYVPMREGRKKVIAREKQFSSYQEINKGNILIVEDTEASRMFVGIVLKNAGIGHDMAKNGLEAIEKFRKNTYDIILMDENMPKCSGSEATQTIRKIEREELRIHTPIISLTANAFDGERERFLAHGMDDYLSKPISPQTLLEMIKKYLD